MSSPLPADDDAELNDLRRRLAEAEEALRAIQAGEVDAIVVGGATTPTVYTLTNADSPYRLLVEQMREGALTVSGDGVILYCNAAFAQIVQRPSERLRGAALTDFIADPAHKNVRNLFSADGSSGLEIRLRTSGGGLRSVHVSSAPITIEGELAHCVVVTDLSRQKLRLRHDAIINSSADAIYSLTLDGTIATWNRAAEQLYGYTAQEVLGRNVDFLFPAQEQDKPELIVSLLAEEKPQHHETTRIAKSGRHIDVALSLAPIQSAGGEIEGISVIAQDITERKEAQARQELLTRELQHRTKNQLAVIHSIAHQTLSSDRSLDEAREIFASRLRALANATTLLTESSWDGASLRELIDNELSIFPESLAIEGPYVALSPSAAQSFALIVHELCTNASKHGAFSTPAGQVAIRWLIREDADGPRFAFRWQESGGPRVVPPSSSSFGTTLLQHALGGADQANIDYAAEGLIYTIEAPLSAVGAEFWLRQRKRY